MCSYLLAMADLSLETARIEERQRRTKRESEELLERTRKGIAKLAQLKRTLSELEREEEAHRGPMQTWNEYMQIMISKDRQYTQQLVNYKVSLTTFVRYLSPRLAGSSGFGRTCGSKDWQYMQQLVNYKVSAA